jgi:hypothetical protein
VLLSAVVSCAWAPCCRGSDFSEVTSVLAATQRRCERLGSPNRLGRTVGNEVFPLLVRRLRVRAGVCLVLASAWARLDVTAKYTL